MEKIGIRREIDKMGRICIPIEMRKLFKLENEVEQKGQRKNLCPYLFIQLFPLSRQR